LFTKKALSKIGIDGAVGFTILTRAIQGGGGLIAIIFITKFLSRAEQGYYYTFASILAIQVFFELGLSGILTQYTAHEFAYLAWDENLTLTGENYYKSRLSSLLRFCVKWFGIISICLFFILIVVGFYFFKNYNNNLNIEWQGPWIVLCLTTSLNLFIDPLLAFFDGLNQVKPIAKLRLFQKAANIIFLFLFFLLGFKLYAAGLASLCAIIINYLQIIFSDKIKMLKVIWLAKNEWVINYYTEIFPYQWRIAISWISGYFIFQLFNPVLFATEGPIVAGQMGMTIAVITGVASISMSWITTKIPLLSTFIAKKDYKNLDDTFQKIFINSIGINVFFMTVVIILVQVARYYDMAIGNRFLSFVPLVFMCTASLANQAIFALATYLRCHKKEPMLALSIAMGILVCTSTMVFGEKFGVYGITTGYVALTLFVGLLGTIFIFVIKRKEWHYE
jgi:hypothetical protein